MVTMLLILDNYYGHFAHDWLPGLAYMKATLPEHVKFLLLDTANMRKELTFIDKNFTENRVNWIAPGIVVKINGELTVLGSHEVPVAMGHKLMNSARSWIIENHPMEHPLKSTHH